jgi:hypothetical protein
MEPKRGKELAIPVPVRARSGSRWMLSVGKRHTTRGARRHSVAGGDEQRCANNDPDKDGLTVSCLHYLQLYFQPP